MMTWNQVKNMIGNYTVIESLDDPIVNVYDLGMKQNVNETLGHYMYGWILPLKPRGDGLSFKKKQL